MPTTVDFPTLVKQALELFGDVFDNEPARRHFAEYLTGLMVAERKNISAINRLFAVATDQSCLNRWRAVTIIGTKSCAKGRRVLPDLRGRKAPLAIGSGSVKA